MFTYHIDKQLLCFRCYKYIQHDEMVHLADSYLAHHVDLGECMKEGYELP